MMRIITFTICLASFYYSTFITATNSWKSNCDYDRWIPINNFSTKYYKAVYGGNDYRGSILHVCRVKFNETLIIPGKAKLEKKTCHFALNGRENELDDFEVLVNPEEGFFSWQKFTGFHKPNAIIAGIMNTHDLFIGRCFLTGTFTHNETFSTDSAGMIFFDGYDSSYVTVVFGTIEFKCRRDMKILVCYLTDDPSGYTEYNGNNKTVMKIKEEEIQKSNNEHNLRNESGEKSDNNNKVKHESSNVIAYVFIPLSIIVIAALISVFFYIRFHRKELNHYFSYNLTPQTLDKVGYKASHEFPVNWLIMKEELGSGFFGVVMKAELSGFKTANGEDVIVAVKKTKGHVDPIHQEALLSELKIYLSVGKHLNIINFLGAVTKGELMLVFEFCESGSLRDYLVNNRSNFFNQLNPETLEYENDKQSSKSLFNQELNTHELICYAFQISEGMKYLSASNIVHRDLAARNVLLTKNHVAKLCDFGLAKDVYEKYGNYCMTTNNPLPLKWMSIEAIRDRVFTSKSDVWAFGVVLWEIFSLGYDPYPGIPIDDRFFTRILDGYRMARPENCPKSIFDLVNQCWDAEPKQRPNFEFLTRALCDTLDEETQNYYSQLGNDYVKLSDCYTNRNSYVEMYPCVTKRYQ